MINVRFLSILSLLTSDHECRQKEIFSALLKTAAHPAIDSIHLFVQSKDEVIRTTTHLNMTLPSKIEKIVELGRMPLNVDFVRYAATKLQGRWVLASNDDVYPEGHAWLNTPPSALLLSRHAKKNEKTSCGDCDATKSQLYQSLCNKANFGSFDAWVAKFSFNELDPVGLRLLATPRHAFGADNLLGHVFENYFSKRLTNLCRSYRLYHIHCTFRTSVANPRVADRGYGERTFIGHGQMAKLLRLYEKNLTQKKANQIVRRRWKAV